jgi:hypothetical protein
MPGPIDDLTTKLAELAAVTDAGSFLAFVLALVADRESAVLRERAQPSSPYGPDAGGWENTRIETYLEAAAAWAESTDFGTSLGQNPDNLWCRFAAFLYVSPLLDGAAIGGRTPAQVMPRLSDGRRSRGDAILPSSSRTARLLARRSGTHAIACACGRHGSRIAAASGRYPG